MAQELGPLARRLSLPYYEDALPAHDAYHADRVRNLALRLAGDWDRSVDRDVLSAAAWFHDVGRPGERTGAIEDHDKWGAAEAADRLTAEGVPTDRIEAIERCIRTHSIRASSPEPVTPEAKLLFDADKLDAIGAVGIVRLACIVGERSGSAGEKFAFIDEARMAETDSPDRPDVTLLHDWAKERLDALYTPAGRRLGESRWQFVEEFLTRFDAETGPDAEK